MPDYDYIIIGSGFGGSVAALRLAEKGYKLALILLIFVKQICIFVNSSGYVYLVFMVFRDLPY